MAAISWKWHDIIFHIISTVTVIWYLSYHIMAISAYLATDLMVKLAGCKLKIQYQIKQRESTILWDKHLVNLLPPRLLSSHEWSSLRFLRHLIHRVLDFVWEPAKQWHNECTVRSRTLCSSNSRHNSQEVDWTLYCFSKTRVVWYAGYDGGTLQAIAISNKIHDLLKQGAT